MSRPSTRSRFSDEASDQRRIADGRAQIGEEAEILAQAQQARLGAHVVGNAVPFRPADGGQQHGVGALGQRHVGFADRLAMRVIGGAADEALLRLEGGDAGCAQKGDELLGLGHDFRADAVAGQKKELVGGHEILSQSCGLVRGRAVNKARAAPTQHGGEVHLMRQSVRFGGRLPLAGRPCSLRSELIRSAASRAGRASLKHECRDG